MELDFNNVSYIKMSQDHVQCWNLLLLMLNIFVLLLERKLATSL